MGQNLAEFFFLDQIFLVFFMAEFIRKRTKKKHDIEVSKISVALKSLVKIKEYVGTYTYYLTAASFMLMVCN